MGAPGHTRWPLTFPGNAIRVSRWERRYPTNEVPRGPSSATHLCGNILRVTNRRRRYPVMRVPNVPSFATRLWLMLGERSPRRCSNPGAAKGERRQAVHTRPGAVLRSCPQQPPPPPPPPHPSPPRRATVGGGSCVLLPSRGRHARRRAASHPHRPWHISQATVVSTHGIVLGGGWFEAALHTFSRRPAPVLVATWPCMGLTCWPKS